MSEALIEREIRHAHFFCGLGGGARGFNKGQARIGSTVAKFRCIGGIDVDPTAIRNFERLARVPGTVLDLFSTEQYLAFHGKAPPPGWREASIEDVQRSFGFERPHIVFLSAPCKGFSGLLAEKKSATDKYQALNGLTLRGVWLMLEAFAGDPPELIIFENVPRIASRGRHLLDQIVALLRAYGYIVNETTHDCGEIGGLAQSRKRFLLVARHGEKVPPFLYEPVKRRLRGVGEVLDYLPLPGDERAGPMHRVPRLQWQTWVRLAFVEAGKDWRSLSRLRVGDDGQLLDFAIAPDARWNNGVLGVTPWDEPSGVVTSNARPGSGNFAVADPRHDAAQWPSGQLGVRDWSEPSGVVTGQRSPYQGGYSVADPRVDGHERSVQLGVRRWDESAGVVTGKMFVGGGPHSVADPRHGGPAKHSNEYRIVPWSEAARSVTSAHSSGQCVSDPRPPARDDYKQTKYRVTGMDEAAGAVIAASTTGNGAYAVADPRTGFGPNSHRNKLSVVDWERRAGAITGSDRVGSGALSVADPRPVAFRDGRSSYQTQGHYGVVDWAEHCRAVTGHAKYDRGGWSVADPREQLIIPPLPAAGDRLTCRIEALDGTWHRPFTTFELAALQSLFDPEEWGQFALDGRSDADHREQIGNAVPADAAAAIAGVMGRTLLMAWAGETFTLSSEPIWVRPIALALAVDGSGGLA